MFCWYSKSPIICKQIKVTFRTYSLAFLLNYYVVFQLLPNAAVEIWHSQFVPLPPSRHRDFPTAPFDTGKLLTSLISAWPRQNSLNFSDWYTRVEKPVCYISVDTTDCVSHVYVSSLSVNCSLRNDSVWWSRYYIENILLILSVIEAQ